MTTISPSMNAGANTFTNLTAGPKEKGSDEINMLFPLPQINNKMPKISLDDLSPTDYLYESPNEDNNIDMQG